jgi:phosphoserine phosphatase
VAPIARALGATHAMATRMVVEDGKYTGDVAFYCFGEGKVQAIQELAAREGYPLEYCYAYSDSVTDVPMLEAVGHPSVVNPDRGLRREATVFRRRRGLRSRQLPQWALRRWPPARLRTRCCAVSPCSAAQ